MKLSRFSFNLVPSLSVHSVSGIINGTHGLVTVNWGTLLEAPNIQTLLLSVTMICSGTTTLDFRVRSMVRQISNTDILQGPVSEQYCALVQTLFRSRLEITGSRIWAKARKALVTDNLREI